MGHVLVVVFHFLLGFVASACRNVSARFGSVCKLCHRHVTKCGKRWSHVRWHSVSTRPPCRARVQARPRASAEQRCNGTSLARLPNHARLSCWPGRKRSATHELCTVVAPRCFVALNLFRGMVSIDTNWTARLHARALGPSLADLNGTVMQRADQSCKRARNVRRASEVTLHCCSALARGLRYTLLRELY